MSTAGAPALSLSEAPWASPVVGCGVRKIGRRIVSTKALSTVVPDFVAEAAAKDSIPINCLGLPLCPEASSTYLIAHSLLIYHSNQPLSQNCTAL